MHGPGAAQLGSAPTALVQHTTAHTAWPVYGQSHIRHGQAQNSDKIRQIRTETRWLTSLHLHSVPPLSSSPLTCPVTQQPATCSRPAFCGQTQTSWSPLPPYLSPLQAPNFHILNAQLMGAQLIYHLPHHTSYKPLPPCAKMTQLPLSPSSSVCLCRSYT